MSEIPTAETPPTQPAMPAPKWTGDAAEREMQARAQAVRHHAVQCAISYAGAGLAVTVGQFWSAVDAFEQYIRSGGAPVSNSDLHLPTGAEIRHPERRLRMSDVPAIEWPCRPANHSRLQTDIRGLEGTR